MYSLEMVKCILSNRVQTPVVTTSRVTPRLLSEQFSKIRKVFESNHYI